ncbi:hypothetical protein [Burkholderia cenocepacia]|uniref:hypothetical protein n=1 Tax=Burkholderia cenocepacia TaxID=95486 RepID=UPI00084659F1|nr:hypothetical protein [Burkholderia cenocepacia]
MTQNEHNVTGTHSSQQVAADLFRIGENPGLPAWQYPVLRQAIDLLAHRVKLADDQRAAIEFALGACAGHIAGERHVSALESLLSNSLEAR